MLRLLPAMLLLLLVSQTAAAPPDFNAPPVEPTDDCYSIDMFSVEFFLDSGNLCTGFAPEEDVCVFYTSGQGLYARAYAKSRGLQTIWDLWGSYLYNNENVVGNRMRCIFFGPNRPSITYFKFMSQALATLCSGSALVMDADLATMPTSNDPSLPDNPSLFYNTEYPAWKANRQAMNLYAIMAPEGTDQKLWYDASVLQRKVRRGEAAMEEHLFNRSAAGLPRRDNNCGAYAGAESDFDACVIPW